MEDELIWLNESFVEKVLRKAEKDDSIEVSNILVKPATLKGDNYVCDVRRVGVKTSRILDGHIVSESRSLIAKVIPPGENKKKIISESGWFEIEASMMADTLPRINGILVELGPTPLSARCLDFQHNQDPVYLISEDLAAEEYRMPKRQIGLDLDHCLLAIHKLAIFHASSIALAEKDPYSVRKYKRGMFHKDYPSLMSDYYSIRARTLGEEVVQWTELSPRIAEKIFKLSESIYEKGCKAAMFREDDFNVLNHGDFSCNNLLFRYDELQKPIDLKFVDFQLSNYGSPAIDILTFLSLCPSYDVRFNNRQLLLHEYYSLLTNTMAKLNCSTKPPSFDNLQEILKQRAYCEVILTLVMLPHVLCERNEIKTFEEIMKPDGKCEIPAYRGKLYRKIIIRTLSSWETTGLLDA